MLDNKQPTIRDGFGDGLIEVAKSNDKVIALTADLASSVRMEEFSHQYPDRFVQVGIAEQNMAGIAAGLALEGYVPYIGSFSSFQPMRNLDQIRTSICIMNAPVKIISSHGSFSFPGDGIQIQALEDVAIMRTLPNMEVIVPGDYVQTKQFAVEIADRPSAVYLRIGRAAAPDLATHPLVDKSIYEKPEIGKAQFLTRGSDVAIITNGYMIDLALQAASQLKEKSIHVTVINMHTVKPLDVQSIVEAAQATGRVITIEENQKAAGLGGAVAEVLTEYAPGTAQKFVAVNDEFGTTAQTQSEIWNLKGLTVENIVKNALDII